MKRLFVSAFMIAVCFSSGIAWGQTIEVVVEDEVKVAATSFTYEISFGGGLSDLMRGLSMDDDEGEDLDLSVLTADELQDLLDKEKFKYSITGESNYEISDSEELKKLNVHLVNVKELERLYDLLKDVGEIEGSIIGAEFEPISKKYGELYGRMAADARSEAEVIAKSLGKQAGEVVSIREVDNAENNPFGDLFNQYSKMMKRLSMGSLFPSGDPLYKTIPVKVIYTFELK